MSPSTDNASSSDRSGAMPSRRRSKASKRGGASRLQRRRHLLESLEARQLLAGPQLIGVQPNQGDLIDDGTVRQTAPRVLTFRFDETQQIDPNTLSGIEISRAGGDKDFNERIVIEPGAISLGDPNENEIVVRFAENLPDDDYQIKLFGYDNPDEGIVGIRNLNGELFVPSTPGERVETINFDLDLGALIESVVPQPVVRNEDGSLTQNRNEVVVYFNEDPLFVENDAAGNPTSRSAENPRFYQLLLTQDTVRTTDDVVYLPSKVVYDEETFTARLFFDTDINELSFDEAVLTAADSAQLSQLEAALVAGTPSVAEAEANLAAFKDSFAVPVGGGTFRLRIGNAISSSAELQLQPTQVIPRPFTSIGLDNSGSEFLVRSLLLGEDQPDRSVVFVNSAAGGLAVSLDGNGRVVVDFGGDTPTVNDLRVAVASTPSVAGLIEVDPNSFGSVNLPLSLTNRSAFELVGLGGTLTTAYDLGELGSTGQLASVLIRESISPMPFALDLPGGNDDPGHRDVDTGFVGHLNPLFGADSTDGITEIAYNFEASVAAAGGTTFSNQITERQRTRVREVLDLWSTKIGVQFRETVSEGITFAVGDNTRLANSQGFNVINANVRVDETFADPAIVFSNQVTFGTAYGEDFTRKAAAGVGLLLGLEFAPELPPENLLNGSFTFLNDTINPATEAALRNLEPVFPGNADVLHGQHLYRPDSVDIDMYRFEVNLNDADRVGTLTVETFAERLAQSSLLDTTLTLFQEVAATATSDFDLGPSLTVQFTAVAAGAEGNQTRIEFVQSDRAANDDAIRVLRRNGDDGQPLSNVILLDVPRRSSVGDVPVSDLIAAINNDPFASSLVQATLVEGDASTDISRPNEVLDFSTISLSGGGLEQLSRNDDYFSEDSFLTASLGAGTYYIGVAASGNDEYNPLIPNSGFGGTSQGDYELLVKFNPNVDEVNVLRDMDLDGNNAGDRNGVPGTPLDGDGDGAPGGLHQFWFQTRPEERILEFELSGNAITPNQTIEIVSGSGVRRVYEFVPIGQSSTVPGSVVVQYNATVGAGSPAAGLANELATSINLLTGITGVAASVVGSGSLVQLTGDRSVETSNDFRGMTVHGRTIFVDKLGAAQADGSIDSPINNIASTDVLSAFSIAREGDQVRIIGNGGVDGDIETEADNFSYQFGITETGGRVLEDGRNMEIPKGVTTVIDAGAALKFRSARIGVGSSSLQIDRSGSLLQVLGTPRLVQLSTDNDLTDPNFEPTTTLLTDESDALSAYTNGSVILTSMRDRGVDASAAGIAPAAGPGDWGGIVYRSDFDSVQGRSSLEDQGIFMDRVNHAEIRFGGGSNLLIDAVQQLVNPITMIGRRPTISFNEITQSADAAISASPDTFEETTFQGPKFQVAGRFIADYDRIGPDIYSNQLLDNSINGLFIRVQTTANQPPRELTVSGRFDDIDVVHYLAENLSVVGTPGGSIEDGIRPDLTSSAGNVNLGGDLQDATFNYRMTFVDVFGFESAPSDPSGDFVVPATLSGSSIELRNLPAIGDVSNFVARRLYRSVPGTSDYVFVAQLDSTRQTFVDDGSQTVDNSTLLDTDLDGVRGRLDASLTIDPGLIVKLNGARIELGHGTQLLAEGTAQRPVVFTSLLDDRFGAGGTFDTSNDNATGTVFDPERGDWSGIYASPNAHVSLDSATIAYAGGVSLIPGGESRGFVPLQLQQATARVVNSRFEFNDDGQDGAGAVGRFGRPGVTPSTIHVRGSQPIIVGNEFVDNRGSIIDIDSNSMTAERVVDLGRQTGSVDNFSELDDNYGPLIRLNRYEVVANGAAAERQLSGLEIRGGQLTTESIWDDTDIVHMLFDSIEVGNLHSSGGLRLFSRAEESLVVKLSGAGTAFSPTSGTGLTATGTVGDIDDRIGGTVQIIGMPGSPVVLTSLADDTVGAGLMPDGTSFLDTNGDSFSSRPDSNDWRSVLFDENANFTNIEFILERELKSEISPGLNGSVVTAQALGTLAPNELYSDEENRLGFEVEGFLSQADDIDTYAFTAEAGTQIWVDLDHTSFTLDSVLEVLDPNGTVIARSDNSFDELNGDAEVDILDPSAEGLAGPLQANANFDGFMDYDTVNPRDAGLRITLPGPVGNSSSYFIRVRSASVNPDDAEGGLTRGGYRFQVRLREEQEFSGSMVRFADIRYANHGIHVRGAMANSPLLGEAQENEQFGNASSNDIAVTGLDTPGQRAQYLGNTLSSRNGVLSVGGALDSLGDIDHYQIDVLGSQGAVSRDTLIFDIDYADGFNRPDTMLSVFYDPDGEDGDAQPRLVLIGNDSNILEDRTLAGDNPLDLLEGGSIDSGDPYIGPIAMPGGAGTYYVAVTGEGTTPDVLSDPLVRLEPIDSILRIVDDQIANNIQTTADGPVEPFFIDTNVLPFGWSTTLNRARDVGHNAKQTFNGSRNVDLFPDSITFETETNNSLLTADDLEAGLGWSLNDDPNVGNTFGTNTSQQIPHTKVLGTTINEVVDVYQFVVPVDGSRVILDIDDGVIPYAYDANPGFGGIDIDPDIEDFESDSVDLKLQLLDAFGTVIATNRFSAVNDGAEGSLGDALSIFTDDPYIETFLQAGVYYVAVSPEDTAYDPGTQVFSLDVDDRPQQGTYELNVSVENHVVAGGDPNNQSLYFDRSEIRGDLDSVAFDLSGYSDADQPYLYFDYLLSDIGNDEVRVVARSDQQGDTVLAGNAAGIAGTNGELLQQDAAENWYQARLDLGQFAGDTNVVIRFEYDTDLAAGTGPVFGGEGLYLDNFIVGFAERGELVVGAASGRTGFTGASQSVLGEYQLEIRPGQDYTTTTSATIQTPTTTFDTNDRLAQTMTIVAPHPSQISDGDTFTMSDNVRSVTFEFNNTGSVVAGNIPIDITGVTSQIDVAERIRTAFNLPAVQALIPISATDSTGDLVGGNNDVRIALSDAVVGDFYKVDSVADVPGAADPIVPTGTPFRLPAIYTNFIGDTNVQRRQDQVFIDSNKISDVHAIGIWSEPGERGVDPQDIKTRSQFALDLGNFFGFNNADFFFGEENEYLQQPPIGNTTPGGVRNLPTLNDSVIGGLAPSVSIVNNTIDSAGYSAIKVDGETRPWQIDSFFSGDFLGDIGFGDFIADGLTMTIDAAGTRVTFEFEDIGGGVVPGGGSGVIGGDGYVDGHVPIYIRHTGQLYNPPTIPQAARRDYAHTRHEAMMAIYQAIQGSILMTNDMVQLVHPTIGPSVSFGDELEENRYLSDISFPTATVFLEGVSGIYFDTSFSKGGGNPFVASPVAVAEAPQPFSRIVNNTIYGQDGTESQFSQAAIVNGVDGDDTISGARDTKVGQAHNGAYITNGTIGNGDTLLTAQQDVDFYEVELREGDRLTVDIDTLAEDLALDIPEGPDLVLRLFDSNGVMVASNGSAAAPSYLETATDPTQEDTFVDPGDDPDSTADDTQPNLRAVDPFMDYTATSKGTYYVAVSLQSNANYDPNALSGRAKSTDITGDYSIAIESYAARNFVLSIDDQNLGRNTGNLGSTGDDLIGTSVVITQIPDRIDGFVAPNSTNSMRFLFTDSVGGIRTNDNGETVVNVPLQPGDGFRTPEIMVALQNAINGAGVADNPTLTSPPLPNHEFNNGPLDDDIGATSGPIQRVNATALGGLAGSANGLERFDFPIPFPFGTGSDFQYGFGHDRTSEVDSLGFAGTTTSGLGTTELYLLVQNAAKIEIIPPEGGTTPLRIDPQPGVELDQLLPETGVMLTGGSSATLINNVLANLNQSVVVEETMPFGFSDPNNPDQHIKPADVVVTNNLFQHDQPATTVFRQNINSLRNAGVGLTTDGATGPSNVNGGTDDFNITLGNNDVLFVNADGDNFVPALFSRAIDSGASSVVERDAFGGVKESVGLGTSNILAPTRDGNGVLRADNDLAAPPSGIGGSLFIDRGAIELADFNGPVATLQDPLDNDSEGRDGDAADSFLRLTGGNQQNFTIQLRDTGDSSNPFTGIGIDDDTVVVAGIDGLRPVGANVAVFENEKLLTEGIDYTFDYDETSNLITLTPLAGVWREGNAYSISLNNRDRSVIVAPDPSEVNDGDQVRITDSDGGTVVFEFESGYQLFLPETLTLVVPEVGIDAGGLSDGDSFRISNNDNDVLVFEFDRDGTVLGDATPIILPETQVDTPEGRQEVRERIARDIETAINSALVGNEDFEIEVVVDGARVVLGSPAGYTVDTSAGGLEQDSRTLALQAPSQGTEFGGVQVGDTFIVSNGNVTRTFEFTEDGTLSDPTFTPVVITTAPNALTSAELAQTIATTLQNSALGLVPTVDGDSVYLNLPSNGFVNIATGQLSVIGVSRPVSDGDIIRVTETPATVSTSIELGTAYPAGLAVADFGATLHDSVVVLQTSAGERIRIQISADETVLIPTIGSFVLDITETVVDDIGNETLVLVSRDEFARRLAGLLRNTDLVADPVAQDQFVFLNLPTGVTASLQADYGGLSLNETSEFEVRRTIEFDLITQDENGQDTSDGVEPGHLRLPFRLTDTAGDLAIAVRDALNNSADLIQGLATGSRVVAPGQVQVESNETITVNGQDVIPKPAIITVSAGSSLEVRGEPGVTESSTVQVFGPLLLTMPQLGGFSITNGSVLILRDDAGNDVILQFVLPTGLNAVTAVPGAILVPYDSNQNGATLATNLAAIINASPADMTATVNANNQISLGRIDRDRVDNNGLPGLSVPGTPGISVDRGIVADGEVLRLRQGDVDISFEFELSDGGGGVRPGNVPVTFNSSSSIGEIAQSLAATISNNRGGLRFAIDPATGQELMPVADVDAGTVQLNDLPGTQVDISGSTTLNVVGVPGGAIAIPISPDNNSEDVKRSILRALQGVNTPGQPETTTLVAENRGGSTLFIENASIIDGPVSNYYLPAIKDLAGNPLAPNREDRSTQFTILMPGIGLDFGDAPDPVAGVPGRYPTTLAQDGPRHVIGGDNNPILGYRVDAETDALAVRTADGDDLTIDVSPLTAAGAPLPSTLFSNTIEGGDVKIAVNPSNFSSLNLFDGETITLTLGGVQATLEYDVDGRFDEDNFAISIDALDENGNVVNALINEEDIADAILRAIDQSPLQPAERSVALVDGVYTVTFSGDDEDGVNFSSATNPGGIINPGVITPIEVTASPGSVLQAWIDFNADGDWDDAGEYVLQDVQFESDPDTPGQITRQFVIQFPDTAPAPTSGVTQTYARFRVSTEGGLSPSGLALSGEVEDYLVTLLPGLPPTVSDAAANRNYSVAEGATLQAIDATGTLTPTIGNDDGLVSQVTDPDGQDVAIFASDVGMRTLYDINDPTRVAGILNIASDGTFTFDADADFSGQTTFVVRATDIAPGNPGGQLVSSVPITATITVTPVNDAPTLQTGVQPSDVLTTRSILEDNVVSQADQTSLGPVVFNASELIDPYFLAGPGSEPNEQELFFQFAGTGSTAFQTTQGGTLAITNNGRTILYTPPADYNGATPDTFIYRVADREAPGQDPIVSETAATVGRVSIVISAINDNPRLVNDSYSTNEDTPLNIPVTGTGGILNNDSAGPADEQSDGQTISLVPNQFQRIVNGQVINNRFTETGGTVRLDDKGTATTDDDELIYTPRSQFSGTDRFTYQVQDSEGGVSTATVTINVGSVNNAPEFVGVNGVAGQTTLQFEERKQPGEQVTFDLNAWFDDPDNDTLTYTVSATGGTSVFNSSISGNELTLDFVPFQNGDDIPFLITARDPSGLTTDQTIQVTVTGSPDAPVVQGSLDPLVIIEDQVAVEDLTQVFFDPDGDTLTYTVTRLGSIVNPTAAQIASHPLVQSIEFFGNSLRITPRANQSGEVLIELSARDAQFQATHQFQLQVLSAEDAPTGVEDAYSVPLGGRLEISDPALGLLRNDFDPDLNSTLSIASGSVTQPTYGTISLDGNNDGTFIYTFNPESSLLNPLPTGDSFTYRVQDNTGRLSPPVTVTITFGQSAYQNPSDRFDVTADGFVTAIDALRVINLLNRDELRDPNNPSADLTIDRIPTSPPDYYDVNGDGRISALDALQVINELNARSVDGSNPNGESLLADGSSIVATTFDSSAAGRFAATQTLASAASVAVGATNEIPVSSTNTSDRQAAGEWMMSTEDSLDSLLSVGFEIDSTQSQRTDLLANELADDLESSLSDSTADLGGAIDSALIDLFSDENVHN
ncbi:pre-peptidase C-terminal domain-containing protein [Rhodopirellula sp. JC740]|uniref:Pre-peptidase C-terminal domain-containing protein n=2 Tax=Rhodopirellula halodulae TaxID=2894198 RepID=A0ABS8NNA0_9BACT|nr:pre-peptidase C-terminal domain-containing protein [Rhodopirellula sp. JC740]